MTNRHGGDRSAIRLAGGRAWLLPPQAGDSAYDRDRHVELIHALLAVHPGWQDDLGGLYDLTGDARRHGVCEAVLARFAQAGVAVPRAAGGDPEAVLDWAHLPIPDSEWWAASGHTVEDATRLAALPAGHPDRPDVPDLQVMACLRRQSSLAEPAA